MMKTKRSFESGFSLVELAIVLSIAGFMLAGAMAMIKPYMEMAQRNTTKIKQENIAKALSVYAQTYYRLPCPAAPDAVGPEPYGAPRGSGVDGTLTDQQCAASPATPWLSYIGIVPFRALGLTEDNVKDSYGNLMTYTVSPVLAGYDPVGGSIGKVHARCRINNIWVVSGANLNTEKAEICCARSVGSTNDIRVLDARTGGTSVFAGTHSFSGGVPYDSPSNGIPSSTSFDNQLVAYVLVSHGKNGDGAYIGQTTNTNIVTASATAQESENRDADRDFVDRQLSMTAGANYFDDIVLWRTNTQLYSEFGNDSCARP